MAVGDLYKMTVSYTIPDSHVTVGFTFEQTTGTNDEGTLQSAVEFWVANVLILLRNVLSDLCQVDQVRMDPVTPNNEIPGIVQLNGLTGNESGQPLPAGSAAVLSYVTTAPNAKHNGRVYIGGISEDSVINGILTSPEFGRLVLLGQGLTNTLPTSLPQTAEFELTTISRVLDGVDRPTPIGFLVESIIVRSEFFSQRRRVTNRLGTNA